MLFDVPDVFPVISRKFDMKEKLQALRQMALNNAARAVVVVGTLPVALAARAQSTDPFDTAVADVGAKVASYGAALVGVAAASVAFWVAIKYVKKIPRAS